MPTIVLISPAGEEIVYREQVGSGDPDFINVVTYEKRNMRVPKHNIAYIKNT
jgi:hypothetical protein